jgi:hypothetical protein
MSSRDDQFDLPGRRVEEDAGMIDEAPLPTPVGRGDSRAATEPIAPNDPLINEPLGDLLPNDPVSEGIPDRTASESPHDPAATGNRPEQPASSQRTPEPPTMPDHEPEVTQ